MANGIQKATIVDDDERSTTFRIVDNGETVDVKIVYPEKHMRLGQGVEIHYNYLESAEDLGEQTEGEGEKSATGDDQTKTSSSPSETPTQQPPAGSTTPASGQAPAAPPVQPEDQQPKE